jgi:uracil-DNA glycosylase
MSKDFHSILTDIERFVHQEQELFGGSMLTIERPAPPESVTPKTANALPVVTIKSEFNAAVPVVSGADAWPQAASLEELNKLICTCRLCPLGATRTKFVFGVGNPHATLMVIGEAPGADEDAKGEPFVGKAGQLLNKILEAVHFKREEVYIANILKCRPPNNRRPNPSEVEQCEPYLWRQIELIQPAIILCLGLTAAQTLLRTTSSMGNLRTATYSYRSIPVVVTYHPAALLRNPGWKRPTWEDVQRMRTLHDKLVRA